MLYNLIQVAIGTLRSLRLSEAWYAELVEACAGGVPVFILTAKEMQSPDRYRDRNARRVR